MKVAGSIGYISLKSSMRAEVKIAGARLALDHRGLLLDRRGSFRLHNPRAPSACDDVVAVLMITINA